MLAPQAGPEEDRLQGEVAAVGRIDAVPSILDLVCRLTGMRFAAIARVTETRWIACSLRDEIGLGLRPGGELQVATTLCSTIRDSRLPLAIDDVASSETFRLHPTPALYDFRSYVSMPIIRRNGSLFGTLCALDRRPARVETPETMALFKLLAELIAMHLDAQDRVSRATADLELARQNTGLREQFIAVLGHDLRNPLAAIGSGLRLLGKELGASRAVEIIGMMQRSVSRMAELVNHLLDFARERLGEGVPLERAPPAPLGPALMTVVTELRAAWPGRHIEAPFGSLDGIDCDHGRIAQLLSNLLANALTHGRPDRPVRVDAGVTEGVFELAVTNEGTPIPPEVAERLFHPFFRGAATARQQGLGLGLYIATAIARAHGGSLSVASDQAATRFAFRMPANDSGRKPPGLG